MKLFIATPIHHAPELAFARSCMRLMSAPPCDLTFQFLEGDSLVNRARNKLSQLFIESDFTHLLWADADQPFEPSDVAKIIDNGKDLVGGFVAKKKPGKPEWVAIEGSGETEGHLRKLKCIGTGFMLIAREVFEAMISEHGHAIEFQDEDGSILWDFWPTGALLDEDGVRRYYSEDWLFCRRWRELGCDVWGDTRVLIRHVGKATFPIS